MSARGRERRGRWAGGSKRTEREMGRHKELGCGIKEKRRKIGWAKREKPGWARKRDWEEGFEMRF